MHQVKNARRWQKNGKNDYTMTSGFVNGRVRPAENGKIGATVNYRENPPVVWHFDTLVEARDFVEHFTHRTEIT